MHNCDALIWITYFFFRKQKVGKRFWRVYNHGQCVETLRVNTLILSDISDRDSLSACWRHLSLVSGVIVDRARKVSVIVTILTFYTWLKTIIRINLLYLIYVQITLISISILLIEPVPRLSSTESKGTHTYILNFVVFIKDFPKFPSWKRETTIRGDFIQRCFRMVDCPSSKGTRFHTEQTTISRCSITQVRPSFRKHPHYMCLWKVEQPWTYPLVCFRWLRLHASQQHSRPYC